MQRSKYRMQQNIMRKNILPKLAVEKRKEVPKHFFIFVVIFVSVVSVVSVAIFFIVPHPMVSTPTIPIGFLSFFFYRMHCVSFHNCKGKSFRPAMEMSLSANKETDQSLKEKRKSTMKESFLVFLWFPCQENIMWEKVEYFRELKRKREGRGKLVNGKNSVRRLVTTLRGKLLWELFPI